MANDSFDPDAYIASKGITTPKQQIPELNPQAGPGMPASTGSTKDSSGFDPDAYIKQKQSGFDPDEYIKQKNQEKYGGRLQQYIAGLEGTAQGFVGKPIVTAAELALHKIGQFTGVSPIPGLNIEDLSPEAQIGREEANPLTHGITTIGGFGAGMLAGTGEAQVLTKAGQLGVKALSKVPGAASVLETAAQIAPRITKYATDLGKVGVQGYIQNYLAQGGDELSKIMLGQGDPEHPVAGALSNMNASGLFGTAIGVPLHIAAPIITKPLKAFANSKIGIKASEFISDLGKWLSKNDIVPDIGSAISDTPIIPKTGVQPTSLEEIQNQVNASKANGLSTELPSKEALQSAISRVEMEHPIHPMQLESLNSQADRDAYQIQKEFPEGRSLQDKETLQKNELTNKTDQTINDVAGTEDVTANKLEGGNQANKYFTDQYQNEKEAAGKLVGEAKSIDTQGVDHLHGVSNAMIESNPELGKMLQVTQKGVTVKPYNTGMGFTEQTHTAIKKAIDALQENPQDFKTLFNVRKGLGNNVNLLASDKDTPSEILNLKKTFMDYMQNVVGEHAPQLREPFKRYAINEQNRNVIEKIFGASVGNAENGIKSKVNPETIIDDMFSDSSSIDAAKKLLPKEKYNHLLGNWISQAREAATDLETNVFSSKKFATFLKKKAPQLETAFSDNPEQLQRLHDLTTIAKIIPDAAPVNPSGTAKTIIGALKGSTSTPDALLRMAHYIKESALGGIEEQANIRKINNALSGKTPTEATNSLINELGKAIGRPIKNYAVPAALKALSTNPDGLAYALDHADNVYKGQSAIQNGVNALFSSTRIAGQQFVNDDPEKAKKMIDDFVSGGGVNKEIENTLNQQKVKQHFAEGGIVKSPQGIINTPAQDHLSQIYPEQTMMMNTAKARVYNYLNSIRPQSNQSKLPFDTTHVNESAKKNYDKALDIASRPLSVLPKIQKGTITLDDVKHMSQMWPEIHNQLSKTMIKKMTESQMKSEKPPYHVRQGLSMFIGQTLDSNLNPQSIMAAQSVFMNKQSSPPNQPVTKNQKNTSKLGEVSKQYMSATQAAESRQMTARR